MYTDESQKVETVPYVNCNVAQTNEKDECKKAVVNNSGKTKNCSKFATRLLSPVGNDGGEIEQEIAVGNAEEELPGAHAELHHSVGALHGFADAAAEEHFAAQSQCCSGSVAV